MASNQRDTPVLEPRNRTRVIHVVNDLLPARKHCVDVDLTAHGLGRARNAARLGQRVSRTQQRLRRHARIKGALATHELGLDDGNPVALLGQAPRQHLAGRAGADHDHVKRSRAKRGSSRDGVDARWTLTRWKRFAKGVAATDARDRCSRGDSLTVPDNRHVGASNVITATGGRSSSRPACRRLSPAGTEL